MNEGNVLDAIETTKVITEVSERCKNNTERIEDVERDIKDLKEENKALYSMTTSIEKMCMKMDYLSDSLDENKKDIKEVKQEVANIKEEPNKQKASIVDGAVKLLLTALGTGIIAFILGQICPTIFK